MDFKYAFGSIDHARLLAIMEGLNYPLDRIELIGNIYTNLTTTYIGEHFGKTTPIHPKKKSSRRHFIYTFPKTITMLVAKKPKWLYI
jgi:hypothetical protein